MEQTLQLFIQSLRCLLTSHSRLHKSRFRISIRRSAMWSNFVANTERELESSSLFKSKVKTKLLDFKNELTFF